MNKKYYIITVLIFILDIITKTLASTYLKLSKSIKLINNFLYLTYSKNIGIAFSMLNGSRYLIILSTILIIIFIMYYVNKYKLSKLEYIGFSFILGGALGNLFDRIVYGYVRDFIDIYIFNYDYPIFNIADMFVVCGVIILIVASLLKEGVLNEFNSQKAGKNR